VLEQRPLPSNIQMRLLGLTKPLPESPVFEVIPGINIPTVFVAPVGFYWSPTPITEVAYRHSVRVLKLAAHLPNGGAKETNCFLSAKGLLIVSDPHGRVTSQLVNAIWMPQLFSGFNGAS